MIPCAPGERSRSRFGSVMAICVLVLGLLAQACRTAGPPPEPVPPQITGESCPLPVLMPAGKPQPRWVRMVNRTSDTLTVFVDRCFWHTRLARVPPGTARRALLPGELIAYDGGLLLHAFTSREHFGSFLTPIRPEPLLEMELTAAGIVDQDRLPSYALKPGEERPATERTVMTDTMRGYTAVWGIGGGGRAGAHGTAPASGSSSTSGTLDRSWSACPVFGAWCGRGFPASRQSLAVISRISSSMPVISQRMRETGMRPEASISSMNPLKVKSPPSWWALSRMRSSIWCLPMR